MREKMENGFSIIAKKETWEGMGIVLGKKGSEYATWAYNVEQGTRSTTWGHYTSKFQHAYVDYLSRLDRGY